jgi:hypothetical protein
MLNPHVYLVQVSSQGILACRAGTRAPPAGTHETKKKKNFLELNSFSRLQPQGQGTGMPCHLIVWGAPVRSTPLRLLPKHTFLNNVLLHRPTLKYLSNNLLKCLRMFYCKARYSAIQEFLLLLLPRVESGECESAPRQSGVTPNWCTPLWTDLLNDYRVI